MQCPRCGHQNIDGTDRCEACLEPFRDRDVPQPAEGLQRLLMEEPVSTLASMVLLFVSPDSTVADAIALMKKNRVGCLLVGDAGKLQGILTERDIVTKAVGNGRNTAEMKVADLMTPDPESVEITDSLRYAVHMMSLGGFRHVPVVENGKPTGLVSAKDVIRFLANEVPYSA